MRRTLTAALLLALACSPALAQQKRLYKWVDEYGQVHYSDKQPPEASAQGRQQITRSGKTVSTTARAKTQEELEAELRAEEQRLAAQEAAAKQAEQDRILLMTFSSVAEIEQARDDRLLAVETSIRLTQERLVKLEPQLEQARKDAANAERSGRGRAADLYRKVEKLQEQVDDHKAFIEKREQDRDSIRQRFDEDLARFKELKGV